MPAAEVIVVVHCADRQAGELGENTNPPRLRGLVRTVRCGSRTSPASSTLNGPARQLGTSRINSPRAASVRLAISTRSWVSGPASSGVPPCSGVRVATSARIWPTSDAATGRRCY